ncbi:TIR-like protein FxsC [Micromonospora mirobrigensis]|uniref:FxsC C-terminal domain-containing protein n=1 Tax=Micromonospora mirobrigensis TaxID=262898 RepID=A0A1C5A3G7_9ACTN|nr:TIR-like protein FxsC [Micromonospora mirobrigensis]SCF39773.1 FxsC C-terminal domain-containing protein [Micromonospora mirobrigensis]
MSPYGADPGTYFFLSYAHSAPPQGARTDTDVWVRRFFTDLSAAVAERARPTPGMRIGFFDQHIPVGADWKAALAEAISGAQVFVPLYSPGYFRRPWALGEQESFRARLAAAGAAGDPAGHVAPVLWIPFPYGESGPELAAALERGRRIPGYAENGVRALCMLSAYADPYQDLLEGLARHIVDVAERHPLAPSRAPGLDEVARPVPGDPDLVVAVLAPTRDRLPPGRAVGPYAGTGRSWRPFGDQQELPVAEYAASTAERLGLSARTVDFDGAGELLDRRPAVLLIDPWLAAAPGAVGSLVGAVRGLRPWVVPLVVTDGDDPQDATRLAEDVTDMLHNAGVPQVKQARSVTEFAGLIPALVTEARRQYLKHGPVTEFPPPPQPPPSLRHGPEPRPRPGTRLDPPPAHDDPASPRTHGENR